MKAQKYGDKIMGCVRCLNSGPKCKSNYDLPKSFAWHYLE